jgi:hypothetical protein
LLGGKVRINNGVQKSIYLFFGQVILLLFVNEPFWTADLERFLRPNQLWQVFKLSPENY